MIVAVIALCTVIAGAVGLVAYLARTALSDRARTADTLFDLATAHGELERTEFVDKVKDQTIASLERRLAIIEKELMHAISDTDPGAGLAADDVRTRVQRIVEAWRADADRQVPAGPAGPVPDPPATE